jgi:nucleoside-diphosphate-sugar epimerase
LHSQKKQTILITGGAGYVGSVLALEALKIGFKVNILDRLESPNEAIKSFLNYRDVNYFQGNLTEIDKLEQSTKGVDFVIHLAGISDGKAGKANPELTKKINVDTLEQILRISKASGVQKFIFASTMGVYGNGYKIPLTENLVPKPIDPYSESKAIGEEIVMSANDLSFSTTNLRIAMVYGVSPAMRSDFIVNRLTLDAIEKKHLTIMGGLQKRPQIHTSDLSNLFLRLLSLNKKVISGQCYNAVCDNPSINNIITIIKSKMADTQIEVLPARPNEDSFEMDGNKLLKQTGFNYQKSLSDGIQEMMNMYSKHYKAIK